MRYENSGANKRNPADTSKAGPTQARDQSEKVVAEEETRGCSGGGPSSHDYSFAETKTTRTHTNISAPDVDRVFDAVAGYITPLRSTVKAKYLDIDGLTTEQVACALSHLADDEHCPLDITAWNGDGQRSTTWRVSWRETDESKELVTDGGVEMTARKRLKAARKQAAIACETLREEDSEALEAARRARNAADEAMLERWRETGEEVEEVERGEDLSAAEIIGEDGLAEHVDEDDELICDGGQQYYVVDEDRGAVVDGPYDEQTTAQTEAAEAGPTHIVASETALRAREQQSVLRWETDDVPVVTDGGQVQGAIDNDFDQAEKDAETVLAEAVADAPGSEHALLGGGDVAIDLVTRQPLFVVRRVADSLPEYYDEEEFDLLTYKQHTYLPVRMDDPVFECVFIGDIEGIHSFSNTYDYPAGRLARVPVEAAVEGGDE